MEIGTRLTQFLLIQKVLGFLAMAFRALVSHSSLDASLTWACCVTETTTGQPRAKVETSQSDDRTQGLGIPEVMRSTGLIKQTRDVGNTA